MTGRREDLSRRKLIAGVAAAPLLAAARQPIANNLATALPSMDDAALPLATHCLSLHREHERLLRRWGDEEAWLAEKHGFLRLAKAQRHALPEACEFYRIQNRLAHLEKERPRTMRVLRKTPATSLEGVIAKLRAAAAAIQPDEFPSAHHVLTSAIADLRALAR